MGIYFNAPLNEDLQKRIGTKNEKGIFKITLSPVKKHLAKIHFFDIRDALNLLFKDPGNVDDGDSEESVDDVEIENNTDKKDSTEPNTNTDEKATQVQSTKVDYQSMKVAQLKVLCKKNKLTVSGTKDELIARLSK
jgi:hypothetical protein